MTPDEELKILKADWAALVAQVSGGEGANLRRDETHPNSGGIAMSKEIMQQALDALVLARDMSYGEFCNISAVIDALRAALAAPQGEPVAWLYQHGETGRTRIVMPDQVFTNGPNQWLMVGPLYQHPPAPLQPVAWLDEATDCAYTRAELDGGSEQGMRPLYAAPPAAPIGEENER